MPNSIESIALGCPECGSKSSVQETRPSGTSLRRRRKCDGCGIRYTTMESIVTDGDHPPADGDHVGAVYPAFVIALRAIQHLAEGLGTGAGMGNMMQARASANKAAAMVAEALEIIGR